MGKLLILITLALMVLPVAAWSNGTNLDFEGGLQADGIANGWELCLWGGSPLAADETTIVHSGGHSQKTMGNGGEGVAHQYVPATVGHVYRVGMWVYVQTPMAYPGIGDHWSGNYSASGPGNPPAWEYVEKTMTADTTSVGIHLDSDGIAYWDDITVTDLGPPSAPPGNVREIWHEAVYYQKNGTGGGNPMGHGQVLVDGNKSVISQGDAGALLYTDEQTNGTAFVKGTPFASMWPANYMTKATTMLKGYLYSSDMFCGIHQSIPWLGTWGAAMPTGRTDSDSVGLVTDGEYLYGSDNTGATDNGTTKIYKWSVSPSANGGSGSLALETGWPVTIPSPHSWCTGIGYYSGKIYAAEAFSGRNIYEIDCASGTVTPLLSGDNLIPLAAGSTSGLGQIARCGDRMVLASFGSALVQWKLISGVWTIQSCNTYIAQQLDTGLPGFMGLSLKAGADGNAKYAWTSSFNNVFFWDLDAWGSTTPIGGIKDNYPIQTATDAAVVTAIAPDGFFAEDKNRTAGVHVLWTSTMPTVGNLVTLKGMGGRSAGGEKTLTAEAVTEGATAVPAVKPLFVTNKNLGPATGGAGLANDGMLVKTSGKVTYVDEYTGEFGIDDGSGVPSSRAGIKGVKVVKVDGTPLDVATYPVFLDMITGTPCRATVTGIVRLEKLADGTIIRRIDALSDADIVVTPL